jgi:hypothetical protein
MRPTVTLVLGLALVSAGCGLIIYEPQGTGQWTKPEASLQALTLDEYICEVTASELPPTPDPWVGGLVDVARVYIEDARWREAYAKCMIAQGYVRAEATR